MKKLILSICLLASVPFGACAQDARQRTTATVIADALAQLPASTPAVYNEVMGELAATGSCGVESIAAMMVPASEGPNAAFEYALNGVVAYVTEAGREAQCAEVRQGLKTALARCTDDANRAFLLSLLRQCATAEDLDAIAACLDDEYLRDHALRTIISIPGSEPAILALIEKSAAPDADLAYAAAERRIGAAEPALLKWAADADVPTLAVIHHALANCGTARSMPLLLAAARAAGYGPDATEATDAALQLAARLARTDSAADKAAAAKAAKSLLKSSDTFVRGGALQVLVDAQGTERTSALLLDAVRRGPEELRYAALEAADAGGDALQAKIAAAPRDNEALAAVIRYLGGRHAEAQRPMIVRAIGSDDPNVVREAIRAAGRIGGEESLQALAALLGGSYDAEAQRALLAFPAPIAPAIVPALQSEEPRRVIAALELAARRRMPDAKEEISALAGSSDAAVRSAAYRALTNTVDAEDADRMAGLLDHAASSDVAAIQTALMKALGFLTPDAQFARVDRYMQTSKVPARYYPVLAATHTPEAIGKLLAEFRAGGSEEAFAALLSIDHPSMLRVLYDLSEERGDLKDRALQRYAELTARADRSDEERFELCRRALELKPSTATRNSLLRILADVHVRPALLLAGEYLADPGTEAAAAAAVKNIAGKTVPMPGGETVRGLLERARDIYRTLPGADAGYSVDEITGILEKLPATESAEVQLFELPAEERELGYKVLFDGSSLDKWQGNKVNYVIRDGVLDVSAAYGGSGNLYTVDEYGDFNLRFEFRFVTEGVNNGIGIRTRMGVDAAYEGMEIQVLDHDAPIYKGLQRYQQHGSVYGIIPAERVVFPMRGTWNSMEIDACGDRIRVTVNGQVIVDGDIREACGGRNVAANGTKPGTVDGREHPGLFNPSGYICFCGHGAGIQFRNVRVRELAPGDCKR